MSEKKQIEDNLVNWFEWFHRHPELSYQEYETTAKIRAILEANEIEILPYNLETGLVATVKGEKEGPVQVLRCDIDALPIQEETGLLYKSKYEGKMHACGHDFHIASGIGCALILQQRKSELSGAVKLIFQPAEESSLGALMILKTDVMNDVDFVWGFHADPTNDVGTLGIREGYVTAAVDRFAIRVKGAGCHGAHPEDGIDPIPAAAAIVQALHTIPSRNINAFHPSLISITRMQAGNTWNVIPEIAELEGTVRTMEKEDRALYKKRVMEIAQNVAEAYGAFAEIEWISGPPATYNHAKMAHYSIQKAQETGLTVVLEEMSLGGDDFSFYEETIPGCYLKVGTGKGPTIHQPGFSVNTDVIYPTAEYLARLILDAKEMAFRNESL